MTIGWLLATVLAASGPDTPARPSGECPGLFGDRSTVLANQAFRTSRLNFVMQGEESVTIVQFHNWAKPERMRIDGLDLVRTSTRGAYLNVHLGWDECPDGTYIAYVDDAVGEKGRVLGIVEGAILLEYDGHLTYLLAKDTAPIDWQMAWSSRFSMAPYLSKKSTPVASKSKPTTSKRSSVKPRRPPAKPRRSSTTQRRSSTQRKARRPN